MRTVAQKKRVPSKWSPRAPHTFPNGGPSGGCAVTPLGVFDPKLDMDMDISSLGFDQISNHKRGGSHGAPWGPNPPWRGQYFLEKITQIDMLAFFGSKMVKKKVEIEGAGPP